MSEIIETKETQDIIDIKSNKTVFECGYEIHSVELMVNGLSVEVVIHNNEELDYEFKPEVRIHNLKDSEVTIYQKVTKKMTKLVSGSIWTKIKGAYQ